MRVEVAVLGFPSLIVLMVSVDIKQHLKKKSHSVTYSRAAAAPMFGVTPVDIIMLFCVLSVCAHESVFKVAVRLRPALTYIVWQQSGFELLLFLFSRALWFSQTLLCFGCQICYSAVASEITVLVLIIQKKKTIQKNEGTNVVFVF